MSLRVKKYGGSSVATINHIKAIAQEIAKEKEKGYNIVVVVSAMSGETDQLLELSSSLYESPPPAREQDAIVATGEQKSSALMAIALEGLGCPACSFQGWQLPMTTDSTHSKARIQQIQKENILKVLDEGKVVVVAGFQGISEKGEVTTLGRGGSDTTAVAIAATLGADACEIYTDVDGVYTADPNICSRACHLKTVTYEEMLELSGLGAKVLQIRAVELARKYKVPLLIKSSFGGERYTWIKEEEGELDMEDAVISGVTLERNEAKIAVMEVPDKPGIAYRVISPLAEAEINVDMILQNVSIEGKTDLTFTVPSTELSRSRNLIEQIGEEIGIGGVRTNDSIAKVSIVGTGMKNHPGVAAKMFETLAAENINIQMISTSEIRISCVVDAKYGELAVRVLHDAFGLDS